MIPPRLGRLARAGLRFAGALPLGAFFGTADPFPGYRLSATKGRLRLDESLMKLPARPDFYGILT